MWRILGLISCGLTSWLISPLNQAFYVYKMKPLLKQQMLPAVATSEDAQRRLRGGKRKVDKIGRDVALKCRVELSPETLTMHYTVTNRSEADIYALDAFPMVDQASRTGYADLNGVYICERQGGMVHLLKGIPPLPPKTVTVRIIPLGTKLAPGAQIERKFGLELPLREKSVYYPELRLEDH